MLSIECMFVKYHKKKRTGCHLYKCIRVPKSCYDSYLQHEGRVHGEGVCVCVCVCVGVAVGVCACVRVAVCV